MIISSEWHDGLHCPTQEEKPGGVFRLKFPVLTMHSVNSQSLIPLLVIRILAIIYLTNSYSNDTLFLGFLQISILQPPFFNFVNGAQPDEDTSVQDLRSYRQATASSSPHPRVQADIHKLLSSQVRHKGEGSSTAPN